MKPANKLVKGSPSEPKSTIVAWQNYALKFAHIYTLHLDDCVCVCVCVFCLIWKIQITALQIMWMNDGLPFNRFDDCADTIHGIAMNIVSLVVCRIRLFHSCYDSFHRRKSQLLANLILTFQATKILWNDGNLLELMADIIEAGSLIIKLSIGVCIGKLQNHSHHLHYHSIALISIFHTLKYLYSHQSSAVNSNVA